MKQILFKLYARLFARKGFFKLNRLLFDLGLRGMGILNYQDLRISGEYFITRKLLKDYPIKVIFDVGAHEGEFASNFLHQKEVAVYSFEPHPTTFAKLEQNLGQKDNIKLFNLALSQSSGTAFIYDYSNNAGSQHASLYEGVITDVHKGSAEKFEIQLVSLDDFVKEQNIGHIGLLKIDTEGNELEVLKGAAKMINGGHIDIVQFEFNEMNVISKAFLKDFLQILPDYNFYRLLPNGLLPLTYDRPVRFEIFGFQNILAILKSIDKYK